MKKAISLVLAILLFLASFGCAQDAPKDEKACRVLCLMEDGIVVEIPGTDLGYVYVKLTDSDLKIMPLDTVMMEFSESDLQAVSGDFTDYFGKAQSYSYILENPKSIRHNTPDEPTFG